MENCAYVEAHECRCYFVSSNCICIFRITFIGSNMEIFPLILTAAVLSVELVWCGKLPFMLRTFRCGSLCKKLGLLPD